MLKAFLILLLLPAGIVAFAQTGSMSAKSKKHPGKAFPNLTFHDISGKDFKLGALKGNYVYIDVWAEYCAPCKAQIPASLKLEEEYKDKNLKFVSITVDKRENLYKWRNYVAENKLGGIQLSVDKGENSDFCNWFNITVIPRFILVDPDGYVIDADTHIPSYLYMEKFLNKKMPDLVNVTPVPD